jgi:hypothetical protein
VVRGARSLGAPESGRLSSLSHQIIPYEGSLRRTADLSDLSSDAAFHAASIDVKAVSMLVADMALLCAQLGP